MTVEAMRTEVGNAYNGIRWKLRVMTMSDRQVIAIYKSIIEEGRIFKHQAKQKNEPGVKKAVQTSMFDTNYDPNGPAI